MAAGFGARRLHWLERNTARQITQCVFRLFLPLQLCFFVMDTDRHLPVDGWTLLFSFVGMMAVYGLLFLLVPILCKRREAWGTLVQAIGYSNYGIFGIPLVLSMYPHSDVGVAAMMTLVAVPVTNAMSTLALIHFGSGDVRHGRSSERLSLTRSLWAPLWAFCSGGWRSHCPASGQASSSIGEHCHTGGAVRPGRILGFWSREGKHPPAGGRGFWQVGADPPDRPQRGCDTGYPGYSPGDDDCGTCIPHRCEYLCHGPAIWRR